MSKGKTKDSADETGEQGAGGDPSPTSPKDEAPKFVAKQPKLGRSYRGEQFAAVKTSEQVDVETKLQQKHNKEGAIPIEAYFSLKGIMSPVMQAAYLRFTTIRNATPEAWEEIFSKF